MATYRAREGETVAYIAWKYYGSTRNREVEQVLEANYGLADIGDTLPAGTLVELPEIKTPATSEGLRLWD